MQITIKLHGILRDRVAESNSQGELILDLEKDATLDDVAAIIRQKGASGPVELALNGDMIESGDHPLSDGDRVDVFRPAAGG